MGRIIINNESELDDTEAISLVKRVLEKGKVSNKGEQYSYLTVFYKMESAIHVSHTNNEKSDSFKIYEVQYNQ